MGYYIRRFTTLPANHAPVIESWWFACCPNSVIATCWKTAFVDLDLTLSISERLQRMASRGVDVQAINALDYLFMHVAMQFVLQKILPRGFLERYAHLGVAEDGPFSYLTQHNWDIPAAVNALLALPKNARPAMVKLTGRGRQYMRTAKLEGGL